MKLKYAIVGFIAGTLVMASGQALADGVSKIGKKIQGEAVVKIGNKELSRAIIVDGKSYAPVKDIVESYGSTASYEKGVITITNKQEGFGALETKKITLEKKISDYKETIKYLETEAIPKQEKVVADTEGSTELGRKDRQERLDSFKATLAETKANIAEAQAQLDEVNKKISELS